MTLTVYDALTIAFWSALVPIVTVAPDMVTSSPCNTAPLPLPEDGLPEAFTIAN